MKFDNMTENEAREQILGMVKEYCDTYHNKKGPFKEGDMHHVSMTIARW